MPQLQVDQLQHLCSDSLILQRLHGVDGKHKVRDLQSRKQKIDHSWRVQRPFFEGKRYSEDSSRGQSRVVEGV